MSIARKNIMLGTAGHVDHGKSALVKLLTGCETDTLAEEKERGLTIDLGFAPCRLADARVVGIVDVPGHVDFIRNMVAGAHGIDIAILVVAADDGIMPQTHEHLHILTLMGLKRGLVALTKIDLVDADRRASVIEELRRLLTGTFLERAPVCPMSNITGEGFERFFDALNDIVNTCEDRPTSGVFRLWVDDAFTIKGSGTVVTGIPVSGTVSLGDRLQLLPGSIPGHVRQMQVYGEAAMHGRAGECVALNLPELDHRAVQRGMLLTGAQSAPPVSMAEAELNVLGSLYSPIKDYLEAQVHIGTAAVLAHVAMLETGEMAAGQKQFVQLRLAEPLPIVPGERFVLRANVGGRMAGLSTIGGGRIVGVSDTRLRRKKQWTLDVLAARRQALDDPLLWAELMLQESPAPVSINDLLPKCGLRREELSETLAQLRSQGRIRQTSGGAWMHVNSVRRTADAVLGCLDLFHTRNPDRAGAERKELFAELRVHNDLFDPAIDQLILEKRIIREGTIFRRPEWNASLLGPDEQLTEEIAAAFQKAGWNSPAPVELAESARVPLQRVEKAIRLLIDRGMLVRLDDRVIMHQDAIAAAKQVALRLFRQAPGFSTMEFRDALAVSRKFAVPVLDHLDRVRFTVRSGNNRTPGEQARKLLG